MAQVRNISGTDLLVGHPDFGLNVGNGEVFDIEDELILPEGHVHDDECTHPSSARVFAASLFEVVGTPPPVPPKPAETAPADVPAE